MIQPTPPLVVLHRSETPSADSEIQEEDAHFERASLGSQLGTLAVIVFPFLALGAAPFLLWGWGFTGVDLGLLVGFYFLTTLGITIGFHRLFTHKAFETSTFMKVVLAIAGSLAVQGPLFRWVAFHRIHHQHTDQEQDPHSPHHHGSGFWGVLKGAWHAHMGWFFGGNPRNLSKYVADLRKSKALQVVDRLFPAWILVTLLLPAVLGGLISWSWAGVFTGFFWGGLVRLFLVHHVTWSVNSACHLWGQRHFKSRDESRNNLVFGVLAMGEGWHNNHHAFPSSARHGLKWWQIDFSYWLIRLMVALRLAWDVNLPSPAMQAAKVRH